MKGFSGYLRFLLFIILCFVFQDINAQFSKTHYIPPIGTTGSGAASPQIQYLYISTPNEIPFNVTINPIGGTPETVQVSNANPYEYYVGTGTDTNFIAQTNLSGQNLSDKGFIIEAEDLVYVSVRLFTSQQYYQAGGIVSKGLAALGEEFRVGTFRNLGNLTGQQSQYLNFISVLASQDNTTVNFSNFGNGVTIINDAATSNIQLNAGESYVIAASPSSNPDNAEGFIGVLVESDKPIAVNSGSLTGSNANLDDGDYGQDVGIDQVAPVERIGSEYIFVRGVGPDEIERPLIIAHEDNTVVNVNGMLFANLANAGDFVSIDASYYGVSYPSDGSAGPPLGQSSNMYVSTDKPVFAFQVIGGVRPGDGGGGFSGIPNQGLFFVPPINCQTPKIVDNIPYLNQIGSESFSGVITLVTETGSTLLINDLDISNYTTTAQSVNGNSDFVTYTIEGLTGNVSVESTSQVYVASFGAYTYATFGGYYSGFAFKPEILLQSLSIDNDSCIPNLTLSLNSISTYDQYQWYYNGDLIAGANSIDFTPSEPGYYQLSGAVENCPGAILSENIPVSACPNDFDGDGVNDNIDIDNDNDGILNCFESLGDKLIDLTGDTGGSIEGLYNYTFGLESSDVSSANWIGDDIGNWETFSPTPYLDSDNIEQDGYISSSITFDSEISLAISYDCITDINTGLPIDCNTMDNEEWFSLKVPYDKTITLIDPDDQILIDTNFDKIFESGITNFSNFEIRFKINGTSLDSADSTFKFYTHLTDFFEMTHFNSSNTVNKAVFNVTATCVPIDSDGDSIVDAEDSDSDNDGILDIIESSGSNYQPLSNVDANSDGYDDIFSFESTPIDSDGDAVLDYLDLDSDNDGIYDSQESGATITDADLDGVIDISSGNIGNNGLFDSIETSIDSGITNFSVTDTDGDGFYNYIDLESDEDNCSDVVEAGYSDGNQDGLLGDNTVTVDSNGLVNNANDGYNIPGTDYIIDGTIIIDEGPQHQVLICENSSFQLSIVSSTIDFYQWESSYDGVNWNTLIDNEYYSGVNSSTLEILTTPISFNNIVFRALVDREGNGCIIYSTESNISVDPVPEVIVPTPLEECDDDYDGITSFNLTDKDTEILNGQTGITVTYHELEDDAETGDNPIADPYLNTTADGQT
ncbi:MAG: gliding motility protein, partial [Bacteroidota bacterium]|nr:gliding motility protein [Bacteroidota bacterium]